ATVSNFLRMLKLPVEVRAHIASGAISMGHAKPLLSLENPEAPRLLAERIVTQGISVRQAEAAARSVAKASGEGATHKRTETEQDPNVATAMRELERALGTRVHLKGNEAS